MRFRRCMAVVRTDDPTTPGATVSRVHPGASQAVRGISQVYQGSITQVQQPTSDLWGTGRRGTCRVHGAATGHRQARPPAAPRPGNERARRVHHRPAAGHAPPSRRRPPSRIPRPGAPDGITDRDYPSGELVPPVRTDVCSMFARMSRSNPAAAGTTWYQNYVGRHVSPQA